MAQSRSQIVLYTIAAVIALAGLADAVYLTVPYLTGEMIVCGGSANCAEVLRSRYAKIAGFPVAALGALGYFIAFSCATFAAFGYPRARKFLGLTTWAMLAGTLWLLFVQVFLLHAYCRFCLLSAALVFILAAVVLLTPPSR